MSAKPSKKVIRNFGETKGEAIMRQALEMKKIPFEQEAMIGYYRVDFLIESAKAVIEIDGVSHIVLDTQKRDMRKSDFLQEQGYILFRFSDEAIFKDVFACLAEVQQHIKAYSKWKVTPGS
ncbi:MAG TPA: DNA (cytosine-5-)-methyltransferase [Firmicutes bacterium]|jgi:very-short-patch-repair endonuclease|nr:DNA (cytosine-5-)-methyltransferase [Bacillota bacterium]HAW71734.1 DNA (cytosine-5-)-methyltransferase [Bacillota bacterium]HAZ21710.1 DNA (cytosine-5-)-methyltransferase [Bacillota bacterium]HBE06639.1 DNA (cytosine-5-)-methyltransferase [Bacillota bacterium]HBL49490.1 DNA (cytosine-5-)-methyltransferase [Bacillota bacterium]